MGRVVRLTFAHVSWLLPVRRLVETHTVIVFEHPAPSTNPHILLVPKRPIRSFPHFRGDDAALFGEMLGLALATAERLDLYRAGFALTINGGRYQDVAQAHLHLTGLYRAMAYAAPASQPGSGLLAMDGLLAFPHPRPQREIHLAIVPEEPRAWADLDARAAERLGRALAGVGRRLVGQDDALRAGYSLLANVLPGGAHDAVCFHLVGGARREPPADNT
jgi:diadenosine tetraphosphate (Ap4A) HIT family hydrolase